MTNKASAQTFEGAGAQDRNLAMELVRVTEAAAIAASEWVGFGEKEARGRGMACLREQFSPEFLGRIDCVAQFRPLEDVSLRAIAVRQLQELSCRTEKNGLRLSVSEPVAACLAGKCGREGGARQLRRIIRDEVEDPLAELLLCSPGTARAELTAVDGTIRVTAGV